MASGTDLGRMPQLRPLLIDTNEAGYLNARQAQGWRSSCIIPSRWRVSDDESRKVTSEGEGACSPRFKVRSHLPLRGKLGWMTPRVGVKTTLTNGNASLGALVPKQGPHFFARAPFAKPDVNSIHQLHNKRSFSSWLTNGSVMTRAGGS